MDLHLSSLIFLALLLLPFLFMALKKKGDTSKGGKLPPGPWKLPVIGSFHHLAGNSLPHRTLRDLAKRYGPLMHLQMGEVSAAVASTAQVAQEIMKTHDLNFAYRPELPTGKLFTYGFTDVGFAPYGAYWRQMRKISLLELLAVKRVESFRPIRAEEVLSMLRSVSSASVCNNSVPVNLTRKFHSLTNNIVARAAFGDSCKYQDIFLSTVKEAFRAMGELGVTFLFPSSNFLFWITGMKARVEKNHKLLDHILSNIIEEARRKNDYLKKIGSEEDGDEKFPENFVDILLKLQQHGNLQTPITDDNIKAVVMNMLSANSETTASVLNWSMSELMRNPRVMIKAQKEVRDVVGVKEKVMITEEDTQHLQYLKLIVKETLKTPPPISITDSKRE